MKAKNGRPAIVVTPGEKIGCLTAIEEAGVNVTGGRNWKVRCDCGVEKVIRGSHFKSGAIGSCGCVRKERSRESIKFAHKANTKHGASRARLHKIWRAMLYRCYDKNCPGYEDYGKRGIKVCPEWHDWPTFREWALNKGYAEHLTIERCNVNLHYTPGNCRWATQAEQARNKRNTVTVYVDGIPMCMAEAARKLKLNKCTMRYRVRTKGNVFYTITS